MYNSCTKLEVNKYCYWLVGFVYFLLTNNRVVYLLELKNLVAGDEAKVGGTELIFQQFWYSVSGIFVFSA